MDFLELFQESSLTLTVNKVRTALAMLGVVIGIGSVIALISLGQGSQKNITDQIQSLGTNLITIMPGGVTEGGVRGSVGGGQTLTVSDAEAITSSPIVTTVSKSSPIISQNSQVIAGRNNTNTTILGVSPDYQFINNLEIELGTFFSESQNNAISRVAVIGPTIVEDLFGEGSNPIGQTIRVNSQALKIIGITASKGGTGRMNPDEYIYVPITVSQKVLFGQTYLSSISVSALNEEVMEQATEQITNLLLSRHKISDPDKADFRLMSQEDLLGTVTEVTDTFTTLLSGIAAISLIVGGIGIMNIMLVTVTERTREIGLRKSLGAKREVIIYQFLLESVIITFIGGIIGILVGITAAFFISKSMSIPFTISYKSILLAFGVSGAIGVIFGWYPAQKAAKLNPIDALRYE